VVFAVGPQWLVPNRHRVELTWTAGQHLVGDLYLWLGLALLVGCAVLRVGVARAAVPAHRWQRLREPVA
jgi:alpha-1,2-mannosyltransferase